jgi:O-antigen/teichoic acid export membrane protein
MSGDGARRRIPRDELAEATALGDVYLRRLRRAQLGLSLLALVAFGGLIGALPLVLFLVPGLREIDVLGVPLSILLIVVPPYPLFVTMGWLYQRRADALDAAFRDLASAREDREDRFR